MSGTSVKSDQGFCVKQYFYSHFHAGSVIQKACEPDSNIKKMKRPFFKIALFLLLGQASVFAQKFSIYQEAGANFTNIWLKEPFPYGINERDDLGNKANFGFEAGLSFRFLPKKRLVFPLGIHFQRKGFHQKPDGPVAAFDANGNIVYFQTNRLGYRFDYLTISPGAEFLFFGQKMGISVAPYFSLRLKESAKIFKHTGWEDEPGNTFVEKNDLGLQASASFYWKRFSLLAKYQHGFRQHKEFDVVDANFAPVGQLYFQNRAVVLGLGFRLY